MPSLNFQKQFVPMIESGQKRQTIRPIGKRPIKVGDLLYLFTGLRTKSCSEIDCSSWKFKEYHYEPDKDTANRLGRINSVVCKSVERIRISDYRFICLNNDDKVLTIKKERKLITADGFDNLKYFFDFFDKQYGLPFEGVLIKW